MLLAYLGGALLLQAQNFSPSSPWSESPVASSLQGSRRTLIFAGVVERHAGSLVGVSARLPFVWAQGAPERGRRVALVPRWADKLGQRGPAT